MRLHNSDNRKGYETRMKRAACLNPGMLRPFKEFKRRARDESAGGKAHYLIET